jgi:hypothetical protein
VSASGELSAAALNATAGAPLRPLAAAGLRVLDAMRAAAADAVARLGPKGWAACLADAPALVGGDRNTVGAADGLATPAAPAPPLPPLRLTLSVELGALALERDTMAMKASGSGESGVRVVMAERRLLVLEATDPRALQRVAARVLFSLSPAEARTARIAARTSAAEVRAELLVVLNEGERVAARLVLTMDVAPAPAFAAPLGGAPALADDGALVDIIAAPGTPFIHADEDGEISLEPPPRGEAAAPPLWGLAARAAAAAPALSTRVALTLEASDGFVCVARSLDSLFGGRVVATVAPRLLAEARDAAPAEARGPRGGRTCGAALTLELNVVDALCWTWDEEGDPSALSDCAWAREAEAYAGSEGTVARRGAAGGWLVFAGGRDA